MVIEALATGGTTKQNPEVTRQLIERVVVFKDRIEIARTRDATESEDGGTQRTVIIPVRSADRNRAKFWTMALPLLTRR